jgi:hypothetical protein
VHAVTEPMVAAATLVRERFPDALVAVLGEAVIGPGRTPTSDLDLVVVQDTAQSRWEGLRASEWPTELFVTDLAGWDRYVDREIRERRPVVLRVTATGIPLTDNEATATLQRRASDMLRAGPPPVSSAELALARRLLADLIDDLRGGTHGLERVLVIADITQHAAELVLLARRHWLGSGKWLARLFEATDPNFARQLAATSRAAQTGDIQGLLTTATAALDAAGGPIPTQWIDPVNSSHNS